MIVPVGVLVHRVAVSQAARLAVVALVTGPVKAGVRQVAARAALALAALLGVRVVVVLRVLVGASVSRGKKAMELTAVVLRELQQPAIVRVGSVRIVRVGSVRIVRVGSVRIVRALLEAKAVLLLRAAMAAGATTAAA